MKVNIYSEQLEIDCNSEQSINQFMDNLDKIVSLDKQTKIGLMLMIA